MDLDHALGERLVGNDALDLEPTVAHADGDQHDRSVTDTIDAGDVGEPEPDHVGNSRRDDHLRRGTAPEPHAVRLGQLLNGRAGFAEEVGDFGPPLAQLGGFGESEAVVGSLPGKVTPLARGSLALHRSVNTECRPDDREQTLV